MIVVYISFERLSFLRKQESIIEAVDSASKPALSAVEWVRNDSDSNQTRQNVGWALAHRSNMVGQAPPYDSSLGTTSNRILFCSSYGTSGIFSCSQ
jgi:hypothetical protein